MPVMEMRAGDISGYLDCQMKIFESLRGVLLPVFIEGEIAWLREQGRAWAEKAVEDSDSVVLVADEAGDIVGMAAGRVGRGGLSTLGFMGVAPAMRRRGIGRELLRAFIDRSREMGFLPEGLLRRHIHGVDAIVYSRFLD